MLNLIFKFIKTLVTDREFPFHLNLTTICWNLSLLAFFNMVMNDVFLNLFATACGTKHKMFRTSINQWLNRLIITKYFLLVLIKTYLTRILSLIHFVNINMSSIRLIVNGQTILTTVRTLIVSHFPNAFKTNESFATKAFSWVDEQLAADTTLDVVVHFYLRKPETFLLNLYDSIQTVNFLWLILSH